MEQDKLSMPKQEVGSQLAISTFYLRNIVLNVAMIALPLMGKHNVNGVLNKCIAYVTYFVNYVGNSILYYVASSYVMSNFGKNYNNINSTIVVSSTILVININLCSGTNVTQQSDHIGGYYTIFKIILQGHQ